MQAYVLKRTLSVVPALVGVAVLVFLLLRLIPGDVVDQMLGAQNTITEGQRQSLRYFFGLDQPLPCSSGTGFGASRSVTWVPLSAPLRRFPS
jgi:peptide/nickel transport system permease protein